MVEIFYLSSVTSGNQNGWMQDEQISGYTSEQLHIGIDRLLSN